MSEKPKNNPEQEPNTTLIYRGVATPHDGEEIGFWWSTNPYYALIYSSGGKGGLFVAHVTDELLKKAQDVSLEAEYQNYLFVDTDPINARSATQAELQQLQMATSTERAEDVPGGTLIRWPENAIEIGNRIFSQI